MVVYLLELGVYVDDICVMVLLCLWYFCCVFGICVGCFRVVVGVSCIVGKWGFGGNLLCFVGYFFKCVWWSYLLSGFV